MDDDGFSDDSGRYEVKFVAWDSLRTWLSQEKRLIRLLYCGDFALGVSEMLGSCLPASAVMNVSRSQWKGVVRNVPGQISDLKVAKADELESETLSATIASVYCITVSARNLNPAPILVLISTRYKGNVGSIIRSAVQANFFEAIYIVDPEDRPGATDNGRISDNDINYYSMMNAPLIPITRFVDVNEFIDAASQTGRSYLATALTPTALNIYSASTTMFLSDQSTFVLLGEEHSGLPETLLALPNCHHLRIPSMSASVNVSSAFSIVLTCMILAGHKESGL